MDRLGNKKQGKKVSYSASLRRSENDNWVLWNWGRLIEFNRNRRETGFLDTPDSSGYNSMVGMIRRYREKENQWNEEREKMRTEMLWLKEELNAIKNFIMAETNTLGVVNDTKNSDPNPIPTFIRAWHMGLEDEIDVQQRIITPQKFLNKSLSPSRNFGLNNLNIQNKESTQFITPLIPQKQKNQTTYFYPSDPTRNNQISSHK